METARYTIIETKFLETSLCETRTHIDPGRIFNSVYFHSVQLLEVYSVHKGRHLLPQPAGNGLHVTVESFFGLFLESCFYFWHPVGPILRRKPESASMNEHHFRSEPGTEEDNTCIPPDDDRGLLVGKYAAMLL